MCLFLNSSRSLLNISCIFLIFASILFPRSWIIFTIIILNSFSGRFPISPSFSCFSGVLSYSFVWYIVLCLFILSVFLWMWFSFRRLQNCSSSCFCCLPSDGWGYLRGLCKLPHGRDWWQVELGVALVARAQSYFNPLVCWSVGQSSLPLGCLAWGDQHWSLPVLLGGANGGLWQGSRQGALPWTSAASVLVPTISHSHLLPLQETLQH